LIAVKLCAHAEASVNRKRTSSNVAQISSSAAGRRSQSCATSSRQRQTTIAGVSHQSRCQFGCANSVSIEPFNAPDCHCRLSTRASGPITGMATLPSGLITPACTLRKCRPPSGNRTTNSNAPPIAIRRRKRIGSMPKPIAARRQIAHTQPSIFNHGNAAAQTSAIVSWLLSRSRNQRIQDSTPKPIAAETHMSM